MTVPIWLIDDILVASLPADLRDQDAEVFQAELLERLAAERARGVILDLTAVDLVDSYLGRVLRDTAAMVRLMGAETVIVGLQPAVAITLVELGLDLPVARVDLNLGRGLAWFRTRTP